MPPLRVRLKGAVETVGDLILAAEERYWEGLELLLADRRGAAIYLMGLSAEMLLKTACFRMAGCRSSEPVESLLGPAQAEGKAQFPAVPCESYHSLMFWYRLLLARRARVGRTPYSGSFGKRFLREVRQLYFTWWISMRYRPDQADRFEAELVEESVSWLHLNFPRLLR